MMQASSWEELKELMEAHTDEAIGLKDSGVGMGNIIVYGVGELPLQFQFSDPTELKVIGADELKENPVILPPYLTLDAILQPEFVFLSAPSSDGTPQSPTEDKKPEMKGAEHPAPDQASVQQQNTSTGQRSRLGKRRRKDTISDNIIDLTQE